MKMLKLCFVFMLFFAFQSACFSMEKIFYILHDNKQQVVTTVSNHANLNPILIAQSYHVDKSGIVTGEIDPEFLDLAKQKPVKLMAMITNSSFDSKVAHQFLVNPNAVNKALNSILASCKKYHLYGVQFDFEMIALADRNALTHFYLAAADLLHKNGFKVSFAVAPTLAEKDFSSYYQMKLYQVWQGAYDLDKLARAADFITIMTYDQHAAGTIPGPIASIVWDEEVIQHALKHIPAAKLSLGIPTYSGFWYMAKSPSSTRFTTQYSSLSFDKVNEMLKKYHPIVRWDDQHKVNYAFFEYNWLNKFVFIEDESSFRVKMKLAKQYHLRGVSVFRLGIEDPKIWNALSS
jgi:spore germination protein YaaH